MCIAAVIFKPISLEYLTAMDHDNPHGGGVAWEQDQQIHFIKGLNAKEIYELQEAGALKYPYLLHFRWATHGDRVPELTHPFVVGPRALLGELVGVANKVLIHNGTWPSYDVKATAHMNDGNYQFPEELVSQASDTAIAAWLAFYDEDILDSVPWATAVAEMRETTDERGNSTSTMDITTRGNWYQKDDNWYSNLNWVPWSGYSAYSKYHSYEDDFCGGGGNYGHNSYSESIQEKELKSIRAYERRNNKQYIGKFSDIEVVEEFYNSWYPEKDNYKPELCSDMFWYDRFNWDYIGENSTKDPETTEDKQALLASQMVTDGQKSRPDASDSKVKYEDWNDYLVSKYGTRVATEVNRRFNADEGEGLSDGEISSDEALGERKDVDPDWLTDQDIISDNPSIVNAWLAKRMMK